MPELHPGPEVSLGMLETQLRELGLAYNAGYFLTTVDGHWVLSVSDENYQRWQERFGSAESEQDSDADEESEEEESTEDDAAEDDAGEDADAEAPAKGAAKTPAKGKTTTRRASGSKTRGR